MAGFKASRACRPIGRIPQRTLPRSGFQWKDAVGKTDHFGKCRLPLTIQEQPVWACPVVGYFRFRQHTLAVYGLLRKRSSPENSLAKNAIWKGTGGDLSTAKAHRPLTIPGERGGNVFADRWRAARHRP